MNKDEAATRAEAAAKRAEDAAKVVVEEAAKFDRGPVRPPTEIRNAASGGSGQNPGKFEDEV
ncbi:hypothetical protein [Promicromonospora iranensis]|uniref:Antitoxin protein of toxin-antitoxin system n=1 Tax=Promicromonospora iranensis TaxID=1105144 RepID=A0ABU2CQ81_9MICO|nr:hypothetical protein [Promicromonospora iranensis]MDR7383504.1 hypothetical protein [Promicromonospora iranensis]